MRHSKSRSALGIAHKDHRKAVLALEPKYWVPIASTKNVVRWKKLMRAVDSIQIGLRAATGFYERVAEESEDFYNRYSKPF